MSFISPAPAFNETRAIKEAIKIKRNATKISGQAKQVKKGLGRVDLTQIRECNPRTIIDNLGIAFKT